MEEIKIFNSPQFGEIRTIEVSGQPYFVGNDVALALGYAKPRNAIMQHVDNEDALKRGIPDNQGFTQETTLINESGVYSLVFSSKLPTAKAFKKWVTSEVLPTIRKTGGYLATKQDDTPEEIMARALTIAQATLAKREERLKQLEAQAEQQQVTIEIQTEEIKKSAPKVSYYDKHLQSVNALTATQIAKEIGMSAEKLNSKLKELGIQFKQSGQWLLKSPYDKWGMHETRTNIFTSERGNTHTNTYTVWTQRGRRFIIALYENDWNVKKAIKQIKGELNPAA